jgi:two-component system cell cycle sensor histidine kinase/response regulator CckA
MSELPVNTKTILLVDDEAAQRSLMRGTLQQEGYTVLESSDYAEALAVHWRHRGGIDMLVADLSLPGGNGYDLSRAMLAIDPHLRVLFISGHAGSALRKFFEMDNNDVHFLQKPFLVADLLSSVRVALTSPRQLRHHGNP